MSYAQQLHDALASGEDSYISAVAREIGDASKRRDDVETLLTQMFASHPAARFAAVARLGGLAVIADQETR